jgi:hypothetical protein
MDALTERMDAFAAEQRRMTIDLSDLKATQ